MKKLKADTKRQKSNEMLFTDLMHLIDDIKSLHNTSSPFTDYAGVLQSVKRRLGLLSHEEIEIIGKMLIDKSVAIGIARKETNTVDMVEYKLKKAS